MAEKYDVIVIGAGHAGCEAAHAAARLGRSVAICMLSAEDRRAHAVQSGDRRHCERSPRRRDRRTWRINGTRDRRDRHPVQSPQSQPRSRRCGRRARRPTRNATAGGCVEALRAEANIDWIFGKAGRILGEHGRVVGLALEEGPRHECRVLVITTGTFLNGLVHVGPEQRPAGRADEPPSRELAESLKSFGFTWGRLKTGTPPRSIAVPSI